MKITCQKGKISLGYFLLFFLIFASCEKLEVDTPDHLLSGTTLFTDSKAVEAAVVGIYATLRSRVLLTGDHQGLSSLMGCYTDELDYYSIYGLPEEQFYKNTLAANDIYIKELWNGAYNQIYAANAIMEGIDGSEHFTEEEQALYKGEALFIRGLLHFYLVNLFGDIPYITTTNYLENKSVSRQATGEVYARIVADLLQARDLLPTADYSGERVRPTSYTASALLARIYLYMQEWEASERYSSEVIENNGWEPNLENVFLKTSTSTIWQFSPDETTGNTLEAQTFLVFSAPPLTLGLSSLIVDNFEEGDLRRQHWVGEVSDGTSIWYYPFKYKLGIGSGSSGEYSIVLRMAEQYLIRAEARTKLGNISGAQRDLNKIRIRAGLSNTEAATEAELLESILQERRIELFTEHGHRFFDLKRSNKLDSALDPVKPGWTTTDQLLPLPENDLLLNPNLQPQNPGY